MAKKASKKKGSKKAAEPRGPEPAEVVGSEVPADVRALAATVEEDGGSVVGPYRDPLGGRWQLLVSLPVASVVPTPFQRDLSEAHVKRLTARIEEIDRFLDPIVVVRRDDGTYWTPNGNHRLASMRALGARSIMGLLVPEAEMAYRILALNTEKSHNLKERCLEVIRMARDLAEVDPGPEQDYAEIFEEPVLLTLGACYEQRARYAGSAYNPVLKKVETFLPDALPEALGIRGERADVLLAIDDAVGEAVKALKERGFDSPYLKNFVVARVDPLRFKKGAGTPDWDETMQKMLASAEGFSADKVRVDQVARSGGAVGE